MLLIPNVYIPKELVICSLKIETITNRKKKTLNLNILNNETFYNKDYYLS